jgi:hypothetical protein
MRAWHALMDVNRERDPKLSNRIARELVSRRTAAGVSIEAIRTHTLLSTRILVAMEQGRFELVADGAFLRGYVKQYLDICGVPEERRDYLLELTFAWQQGATYDDSSPTVGRPGTITATAAAAGPTAMTRERPPLPARVAAKLFSVAEALLPKRIASEELGDAEEFINTPGRPTALRWIKVFSALFWVTVNSLKEVTGTLSRSKAG